MRSVNAVAADGVYQRAKESEEEANIMGYLMAMKMGIATYWHKS